MSRSINRFWILGERFIGSRSAGLRTRFKRRALGERLEQRLPLTSVIGVNPPANSHSALVSTNISATFDQVINAATATPQSFAVHSAQRAPSSASQAQVSTAGATVTLDPTVDFFPGEIVQMTATPAIQSANSSPVVPAVWQFRAGVTAGSGIFFNTGQSLGGQNSTAVSLGDLDSDGDLDAFVVNLNQPNRVWLNDDGEFRDSGQSLGVHGSFAVDLGDLDADGDLDAFVVNTGYGFGQANRVWLNESGQFSDSGQQLGNHGSRDVSLGDLDGDGDLDAFAANAGDRGRGAFKVHFLSQPSV